jgi:hypothetical protein
MYEQYENTAIRIGTVYNKLKMLGISNVEGLLRDLCK